MNLLYVAVTRPQNVLKMPEGILRFLGIFNVQSQLLYGDFLYGFDKEDKAKAIEIVNGFAYEKTKNATAIQALNDTKNVSFSEEKSIGTCADCGGEIWKKSNTNRVFFVCRKCRKTASNNAIKKFLNRYEKSVGDEEISTLLEQIFLRGFCFVSGLISPKNKKRFDAKIVLKESEKYGWTFAFLFEKNNASGSNSGGKRQ